MSVPGIESGIHVFFALLGGLTAALLIGLLLKYSGNGKYIKYLAILFVIFVWLSWITVAPVYTQEYGADKAVIKSFPETKNAHSLGMETKEHIFYTGLILSLIVPIAAYTLDLTNPAARKFMLWLLAILLIGFIVMDALGAWISISAKQAWSIKAGG